MVYIILSEYSLSPPEEKHIEYAPEVLVLSSFP